MNEKPLTPSASISPRDIMYVIFRHKWKIAFIAGLGFLGVVGLHFWWPRFYLSEAKLFIKYVVESKSPTQLGPSETRTARTDEGGESVINTELEILTSLDLAQQVVAAIGPEKILARLGGGSNTNAAAGFLHRNISAEISRKSKVIHLTFQHPDPALVQPVLNGLIQAYLVRHEEIHRAVGVFDDFLVRQTDQIRSKLAATDEALRSAKAKAGVISLDETKKGYTEQVAKIRQQLLDAEAELAERRAAVAEMARLLHVQSSVSTNKTAAASDVAVAADKLATYQRLCTLLEVLGKREQEFLLTFTSNSTLVKDVQSQIGQTEALKQQLEAEYPALLSARLAAPKAGDTGATGSNDLVVETAKAVALESKIKVLTSQLEQMKAEATVIDGAEGSILALQRQKELEEANYKYFSASLEQAKINETLGPGRVSNISLIQAPTPPRRDNSQYHKLMAGVFLGSVALAFAVAFAIELFLDTSVKRPGDVSAKLGVPLFISIPRLVLNGKRHALKAVRTAARLRERNDVSAPGETVQPAEFGGSRAAQEPHGGAMEITPWDPRHKLRPFSEALRDRLIAFFEAKGMTHKPKLVALTCCSPRAGVSSIAAGLAASLSETGEGNVLLVDMNGESGAACQFRRGDIACGLDDALEADKRETALVQDNLYVVAENNQRDGLTSAIPKGFKSLVPRLKASDYDYIIFDLPVITQISITPRLARFMDMNLMVIEAEKTDAELIKRASALMEPSGTHLGIVLNKTRSYIPARFQQEI